MNAVDLNAKIKESMEALVQETDEAGRSEMIQGWLIAMSKFHDYSFGNVMLICRANPDATRVAGFHTWLKLKRYVKKGEKGIPILAPIAVKIKEKKGESNETDVDSFALRFKVVYVFDVSQTDGESLPELQWLPVGGDNGLVSRLEALAERLGIKVKYLNLGITKGVSTGGLVAVQENLDLAGRAAVLVHEISHELAHQHGQAKKIGLSKEHKECEAESATFVVCKHFGIEARSGVYLASWGVTQEMLALSLNTISTLSKKMITALEDEGADVGKLFEKEAA